jgi:hypothetical protein
MASDGSNLYLAVLTSAGKLNVYKSASGTSAWASVGGTVTENAASVSLVCKPGVTDRPVVSYILKNKQPKFGHWNGTTWTEVSIPTRNSIKVRELQAAFTENGALTAIYVDTTSSYKAYYVMFGSDYSVKKKDSEISSNVNGVNLAVSGNTLYMGFLNRDTEHYGPYVYKGSASTNSIDWNKSGVYGASIHEGLLAYHISITTFDGKLYAIVDDKGKPSLAQSHVFKLEGNTWKLMGENELPYFKAVFYNNNNYYLRGSVPSIAVAGNGGVYISMLAWENAGGSGKNFGPIVMKYVADSWTVH